VPCLPPRLLATYQAGLQTVMASDTGSSGGSSNSSSSSNSSWDIAKVNDVQVPGADDGDGDDGGLQLQTGEESDAPDITLAVSTVYL
jgi:hypothetical protein